MFELRRRLAGIAFVFCLGTASLAQAQSWKPALGDADELYDAAEDLHDRAERFQNPQAIQVTAQLEQLTTDLYRLLKRKACPTEVLPVLSATGAALEEASALVALDCDLRRDRKAQSELANAQRYFNETFDHIQCALRAAVGDQPVYRAPTSPAPILHTVPGWYQAPPAPIIVPYGYEVRHHSPAPHGLPRVRIAAVK